MSAYCPQCGAPTNPGAAKCEYCGAALPQAAPQPQVQPVQPQVQTVFVQTPVVNAARANWPIKNKIVAAILAFLLGGLGIHKFYLGQTGMGVLYLLFCWTTIPAFIAFVEGIIMLTTSDENFQIKYQCRLG